MIDRVIHTIHALLFLVQIGLVLHYWNRAGQIPDEGRRRTMRWLLAAYVVFVTIGLSLNAASVRRAFPAPREVEAVWRMGTSIWLGCSPVAFYLSAIVRRLLRRRGEKREIDPGRRRLLLAAQGAAVALPFTVVAYGALIERRTTRIVEVELPVRGLPRDLAHLRIAQISDIHLSATMSVSELARIIDQTNELRPHITVVTGDLITKFGDPLDECMQQLARLRTEAGVFGCMGNHEMYAGVESEVARSGRRKGLDFLRYEARELRFGNASLNIVGVDYEPLEQSERYLERAAHLVRKNSVNLLLSHNPDVIPAAVRRGFQVTLAGHTHGGQVNFEILHPWANVARFYTPFVYGQFHIEENGNVGSAFVTRGVGTVLLPIRLGAPPEIAVIRLKPEAGSGSEPRQVSSM